METDEQERAAREEPPGELPRAGLRRLPPRQGVHWSQPEVAWPLAIFGGVAGTWAGLSSGLPGVAAAAPVLLFAPLFAGLLGRGRRVLAAFLVVGWALGVSGGVVGTLLEAGVDKALMAVPFAELWSRTRLEPWLGGGGIAEVGRWAGLPVAAGVLVAVVLFARVAYGLGSLLVASLAIGAVSGGVARCVEAAVAAGGDPVTAVLEAWPPHTALQLLGALLLVVALSEPIPLGLLPPGRRTVLRLGAALALAGLALEPVLLPGWGGRVGDLLGGR